MGDKKQKVLLFWCEDQQWSIVNVSAVKGETKLGVRTQGKFQGKWYPAILVAKDFPEALKQKEEDFKGFLNNCLQEEAPEDVENCVLKYINDTHEMVASTGTDAVEPLAKRVKLTMQASREYAHQKQSSDGNDDDVKLPAEESLPLQKPAEESLPLQEPVEKKPDVLEKQGTVSAGNSENLQRTVDELQGTVKKLKDRIKKLEKWQMTVELLKQEPSTSVQRPPESSTSKPNPGDSSLFNGNTYQMLQDSVNFTDDLYSTVMTLVSKITQQDRT